MQFTIFIYWFGTRSVDLFDYIPVATITESAFSLNADPRIIEADMQVFPVSPPDVATMSATVNAATKVRVRKTFLIIVVCPGSCRAQLFVRYLTFMNSFHWR